MSEYRKIFEAGLKVFEAKINMPAYKEYKENPKLAEVLKDECVREALQRAQINAQGKGSTRAMSLHREHNKTSQRGE